MPNSNRRRHFLIDKPLQFRYMAWILLTLSVVTSAIFVGFYYGVWEQTLKEFSSENVRNMLNITSRINDYENARYQARKEPPPRLDMLRETELYSERQKEILAQILRKSEKRIFVLSIPLFILIAWGTIFLSHKIAGPIYHIDRVMKEVSNGNLKIRVKLRKFDEAQKLSDSFNAALKELDDSVSRIKKIIRETDDPRTLKQRLNDELSKFTTSG